MHELRLLSILIVTAPLLGAIIAGLYGKYIGKNATHALCCTLVGVSFALSFYLLYGMLVGKYSTWDENIYTWGKSGNLDLSVGFLLDKLSVTMIAVVNFVSFMVHIYSIGYMQDDPGYQRFFSYISLFTFAMLMLVMANNFLQLFFGWEGVGLVSYLLIGFWYQKPTAIFANLKAFIINRIGDCAFVVGIAAVWHYSSSLDYTHVFASISALQTNQGAIDLICICLFIGAMAKSAQIPLHVWLPDSMEGPTPISALIHAATMVTAGVFMIARMSPIFEYSESTLVFITFIGALTSISMGILAIVQRDIKRIIAYSTLSQLGYMIVGVGVSAYAASMFHLVTHAFFKALLFLGAGSVIIAMHHEQDIFKMGNLRKYMPITFVTMFIGTIALIGFPGTAGFYSKDLIIEAVSRTHLPGGTFAYWAVLFGVFFTSLYSFRLLFLVFFTKERMSDEQKAHLHESKYVITVPLILLAIPSLILGAIFINTIMNGYFGTAIHIAADDNVLVQISKEHYHGAWHMFLHGFIAPPFVMVVLGVFTAWYCYIKNPSIPEILANRMQTVYSILLDKYGFDILYEKYITPSVRKISEYCWLIGDVLCIDHVMVNGSAKTIGVAAKMLRKMQSGYLYHYVFAMVTGFLIFLVWLVVNLP